MTQAFAKDLCLKLMNTHFGENAKHWKFKWIYGVTALGRCMTRRYMPGGVICLNADFVCRTNDENEVRDTILHEIAHGLAPGHGHDYTWQAKCREIGANPQRLYDGSVMKELRQVHASVVGTCPGCGHKFYKMKFTRSMKFGGQYHKPCRYTESQGIINWQRVR